MIKKYLQFLAENKINGFNSIGEWVESLIDDDYIKNIVNRFTKDIDYSVDLSNAINILDDKIKKDIKSQIENYLQNGIEDKEPNITASTNIEQLKEDVSSEITISGKGIFTSFLKSLTGLGRKETIPNYESIPNDFLIYYHYDNLNYEDVKQIFSRFKSLTRYIDSLDYQKNELDLYFGIKCNGELEYGIRYDSNIPIGRFKLSKSAIKWICQIDSKSAASLKKEIVNLTYNDIILFGNIKLSMEQFNPGYFEKKSIPTINDRIITFAYYGIGKWENGKLDETELQNIKNRFNTWLASKKWNTKVLINIKSSSFWVYLSLKLK